MRVGLPLGRLRAAFADEGERWILWLPVFFGAGIGVYFALPAEPPPWLGAVVFAGTLALGVAARRWVAQVLIMAALGTAAAGFTVVQWRTQVVAAPMLTERLGPVRLSGRVAAVETRPSGARVTLERPRISRLAPALTPERVRVRLAGRQPELAPGDWVSLRAIVAPPPAPAAPGAFDFQRRSFFMGLGGVGFALGSATITTKGGAGAFDTLALAIARVRQNISRVVMSSIDGAPSTVAAALMTGQRGAIPPSVMSAFRDSGLAHLLAISGLHIGLVAGIIFIALRGALALVPALALVHPIKKWAAVAAIAGAFAYTVVAGATVPTQRAFLMIGLVLMAVLFDRRGLSMRLVAWAAFVVLLLSPESLLGASFQLSFAAVIALIAAYEALRERRRYIEGQGAAVWRRVFLYIGGVALTTLIAGSVTAPFAVYHFNRFAAFGLAANLIAVPVTALWIMPWAVAAFLLMPFGMEAVALTPMGWGTGVVIAVAEAVAAWPGAVTLLPAMPEWGLVVMVVGGLWLCLWRRPWRLWGAAGVAVGVLSILMVRPPDILIDGAGRLLAVRTEDGLLAISSRKAARFNREVWLRRAGQEEAPPLWPKDGDGGGRMACDALGCIYRAKGHVVSLVRRAEALGEDCWSADVVVSVVPVRAPCPSAHTVIDRFDLWREGGHAVWMDEGGRVRVESVNESRGRRPWVVRRK